MAWDQPSALQLTLWTPSAAQKQLPLGESEFPFSLTLPAAAAPSFQGGPPPPEQCPGEHGFIRYALKATLVRPWLPDCKQSTELTVLPFLDLNAVSGAGQRVESWASRDLSAGFFGRSGALRLQLSLPRAGFVPGEELAVQVTVQNNSDKKVKQVVGEVSSCTGPTPSRSCSSRRTSRPRARPASPPSACPGAAPRAARWPGPS